MNQNQNIFILSSHHDNNVKNNKITSNSKKKTRVRATGNREGTQGLRVKRLPGLINEQFYSISTNKSERLRRNLGFNYAYNMKSIAKTVQVYSTDTLKARNNI